MMQLNCVQHHIPFSRVPLCKDNILAYRALKKLVEENHYDVIHTHTPNASAIVRVVCRKLRKKGLKVFYTAHGFHFYKGAPLQNWLVYFPVEWSLAHLTDVLITMNEDDYVRAQSFGAKKVCYVPGVGIDLTKFAARISDEGKKAKRLEVGLPADAAVLISVGELNRNKNHEVVIRALARINDPNVHYCIVGAGSLSDYLKALANELGVGENVHLLGYRNDVAQLYAAGDICCFPSFREGLPVSLMEAMACGLPVVCSDIRGNRDLIKPHQGGLLCQPNDSESFESAIRLLLEKSEIREEMGRYNYEYVQRFSIEKMLDEMKALYSLDDSI